MEPLRASSAKLSKDQPYISTTADSVIGKEAPCVPASTACAVYKDYIVLTYKPTEHKTGPAF